MWVPRQSALWCRLLFYSPVTQNLRPLFDLRGCRCLHRRAQLMRSVHEVPNGTSEVRILLWVPRQSALWCRLLFYSLRTSDPLLGLRGCRCLHRRAQLMRSVHEVPNGTSEVRILLWVPGQSALWCRLLFLFLANLRPLFYSKLSELSVTSIDFA